MARRGKKKGRPVSGWLVYDKPVGMGSTEAVAKVKRLFGAEKAGHAGTLDPLASGVLPIALGEATKTVPYVMDGDKTYRFTVAWGEERDTDDREGAVVASAAERPDRDAILAVLPEFTGVIQQVPPRYSAIKVAGERAYDLARGGEIVDLPAREIEIGRLDIVEQPDADHAVFEIDCGKGTYVRSLARDIGRRLGCRGHVAALRRLEVYPFGPERLVTDEALERAAREGEGDEAHAALDRLLVDTGAALECLPKLAVTDDAATRIRLGNPVVVRGRDAPVDAAEAFATARGRLVAIGEVEAGMFKPRRVFSR